MSVEKIWLVMDGDGDWPVAAYDNESLASHHAKEMGCHSTEVKVLTELPDEVTNPDAITKRAQAHTASMEEFRRTQAIREQQDIARRDYVPTVRNGLCHCQVFSHEPLWNVHGYCQYCGGTAPEVFRKLRGEEELAKAISLLDYHYRTRMSEITGTAR